MPASNNHGGTRPGAGRPKKKETLLAENKALREKLAPFVEAGMAEVGERYPEICRKMVYLALGDEKRMPNVVLLKTLFETLAKVVDGDEASKESVVTVLIKDHLARVRGGDEA